MAFSPPTGPTRLISWQQRVQEADPDYIKRLTRPIAYVFGNGRKFEAVPNVAAYGLTNDWTSDFTQDFL